MEINISLQFESEDCTLGPFLSVMADVTGVKCSCGNDEVDVERSSKSCLLTGLLDMTFIFSFVIVDRRIIISLSLWVIYFSEDS